MSKIQAKLHYEFREDELYLYVTNQLDNGDNIYYTNITCEANSSNRGPMMKGFQAKEFMQAICDEAFANGIYPKQLADKKDELKATQYHLEDMRKLVFKDAT